MITRLSALEVLLVISVLFVASCGTDPVSIVKTGTLSMDQTVTLGNVFHGYKYFKEKKWGSFETEQKRTVVEFSGKLNMDALWPLMVKGTKFPSGSGDVIWIAQFAMNQDGKTFQLSYNGFNVIQRNGTKHQIQIFDLYTLKNIFKNEPIWDYSVEYILMGKIEEEKGKIEDMSPEEAGKKVGEFLKGMQQGQGAGKQ